MTTQVELYGRNLTVDKKIEDYIHKRTSRLDRFLSDIEEVRVDLAHVKSARSADDRQVAQITVRGKRFILRSEERADDIYVAFDRSLDKIQRQIERYKGKRYRGRGDGKSLSEAALDVPQAPEEEEAPVIARRKTFTLTPMDEEDAIEQMQLLGHDNFFIFYNANTNAINVLYHRLDGSYGLIEPEIG